MLSRRQAVLKRMAIVPTTANFSAGVTYGEAVAERASRLMNEWDPEMFHWNQYRPNLRKTRSLDSGEMAYYSTEAAFGITSACNLQRTMSRRRSLDSLLIADELCEKAAISIALQEEMCLV